MRFFTPELYLRFNSPNDEEADRADEAWEAAILAYRHHLDGIRARMPSQVRKLAALCLHDAQVLACRDEQTFPALEPFFPVPVWVAVAMLSLKQEESIVSLTYFLWDRIREYPPGENWPFSKVNKHWLYDELDLIPDRPGGFFLHRILLSDGSIIEIPFVSVLTHSFSLSTAGRDNESVPVTAGE